MPPAAVVVTGWLSAHTDTRVVAYWLGAVAGVVSYALVLFGLRPAPYARTGRSWPRGNRRNRRDGIVAAQRRALAPLLVSVNG